jgi:DNA-binding transcriptional LysR family regulator
MFDDPLFTHQGRALAPTPLTRGLIEPLRRSLRGLGALLSEAGEFDPRHAEARFTVAMRDPVELLVLPEVMAHIARAAPAVDLRTVQVARRNLETGLASGALDLAIDVPLPLSPRRSTASALPPTGWWWWRAGATPISAAASISPPICASSMSW